MRLINCEVNLILTWSTNYVIIYANVENQNFTPEITETKLYFLEVTWCKTITNIKFRF